MPVENGVGNGPFTPTKQQLYRGYLRILFPCWKSILPKNEWASQFVVYFDITAGPGKYPDQDGFEIEGSPIIFVQEAESFRTDYRAEMIESNKNSYLQLNNQIGRNSRVTVWHSKYQDIMPILMDKIDKPCYGLLYADPNGVKDYKEYIFPLLREMSRNQKFKTLDFILHFQANSWNRARRVHGYPFLENELQSIAKKKCIIRKLYGNNQHTFIVLSNWLKMPVWEQQGFRDTQTLEGQQILDRCNYTDGELKKKYQMTLPSLTELMKSTSDTQPSEPSGEKPSELQVVFASNAKSEKQPKCIT